MTFAPSSTLHKTIRFSVFLFGLVISAMVISRSYQSPAYFFLQLLFGFWLISPNIVLVLGTWRLRSTFSLFGLALILCSIQLYFVVKYFTTHHATAPIILLISPIPEFGILALGLAIAYLAEYGQHHWHNIPPQAPPQPVAPTLPPPTAKHAAHPASGRDRTSASKGKTSTRRGRASVISKVREKRKSSRPKKGRTNRGKK